MGTTPVKATQESKTDITSHPKSNEISQNDISNPFSLSATKFPLTTNNIRFLQRAIGNQATTSIIRSNLKSVPNRDSSLIQRGENDIDDPEYFNFSGLEAARANFERRILQIAAYQQIGLRVGDTVRTKLTTISDRYQRAYDNYSRIIHAAREEARNQERWINICVGIGAGILMSVGAAFILPSTAGGWFALSLNELLVASASAAGQAVGGAALGTGVGDALRPAGTDLQPGGLHPNVLRLSAWQNVAQVYRRALALGTGSYNLHLYSMATEYLLGQIRLRIAGGSTDMSDDQILDSMVEIVTADQQQARYDQTLSNTLGAIRRYEQAAIGLDTNSYTVRNMEQDIWILWMSELDDPSVLDLDAIEDYLHGDINILGSGSILGVDFGSWTSDEDEQEARDAARRHAGDIQARYRELQSRRF